MDPERRRRIEAVCDAALGREAGERAAFVDVACEGDGSLVREVNVLLAHAQSSEGFLETPINSVAASLLSGPHSESLIGRRLGVYTIREFVGAV